jgi:hypothetical protein
VISVIIPAYNEGAVIRRCLESLARNEADRAELEIIVVCNGCSDDTARVATEFGPRVRVIETPVPSKANALNLGDEAARGAVRFYLDADVVIEPESIRLVARALEGAAACVAAPVAEMVFHRRTNWAVKAYFRFWTALPYIQEGLITAGVYALNAAGRARLGRFPEVIADDGYVRLLFEPHERIQVAGARSRVFAPLRLGDLLKIRTRARLGVMQLQTLYPDLFEQESGTKSYGKAMLRMLLRPRLYPGVLPYLYLTLASRLSARRLQRSADRYVWQRDESSRLASESV